MILIIIIEEHNELFKEIALKNLRNHILVNIDEHADFFTPIVSQRKLYSNFKSDIEKITYNELRISDFILLLFERGHIDKYIWISNKKIQKNYKFNVRLHECDTDKVLLKAIFSDEGKNSFHIMNINSRIEGVVDKKCIVSIDLDYFHSNDINGERILLEITDEEYKDYISNKYHVLRLSYGNRCRVFEDHNKFFVEISESKDLSVSEIDYYLINKKIEKICEYLEEIKEYVEYVFICKSIKSEYMSEGLAKYILSKLKYEIEGKKI